VKQPIGSLSKYSLSLFLISLGAVLGMLAAGYRHETGPLVVLGFVFLAFYFMGHAFLRSIAFTVWVFAFVAASLFYPGTFGTWFGLDLKRLILPLIQIIMFGMGTTLSVSDFSRVFTMPWPVFIGMALQYTVMPLAGFALATSFGFEAEVAAGVILIGSCPGGVASNLMTYLARGNVALSVTMTSCSTLASPLVTPFLMKTLAGQLVPVDFVEWMLNILNMIIVPIVAGLVANRILYSKAQWANRVRSLLGVAIPTIVAGIVTAVFVTEDSLAVLVPLKSGIIIGLALVGIVALLKLTVSVVLRGPENWMDKTLPIVSMAGICFIIAIITVRSREQLLTVGLALIAVAIVHNLIGYVAGYWCAKLARLDTTDCRTVAIEVGLQNGGMASGLAINVLQSAKAALAPAIFGPWMNISGSMLATWWHRRPVADNTAVEA
jgi:BASS family bile acid:Na+ symporter